MSHSFVLVGCEKRTMIDRRANRIEFIELDDEPPHDSDSHGVGDVKAATPYLGYKAAATPYLGIRHTAPIDTCHGNLSI